MNNIQMIHIFIINNLGTIYIFIKTDIIDYVMTIFLLFY